MIIWHGYGILAAVIYGVAIVATGAAVDAIFGDDFYVDHGWPKALAGFVAAVPIWYLGIKFNVKDVRVLIDPETEEEVIIGGGHSLFFIPMQYWAFIFLAISIVFAMDPS